MRAEDAEEFTQSLEQIVTGSWRQIALAERMGVPKALDLDTKEWVKRCLGGYKKLSAEERKEVVKELTDQGMSQRSIGGVLGVAPSTVNEDLVRNRTKKPKRIRQRTDVSDDLVRNRTGTASIHTGDFRLLDINPGSINWIVTDPPYADVRLYSSLAEYASNWLMPGGGLLAMSGHYWLQEVLFALSEHLTYRWVVAYLTPGGQSAQIWPRKVNTFWKPVLVYTKGECGSGWFGDVCTSAINDNDKSRHEWGQSESGMYDLMKRFCKPGEVVLDPMMGSGTTGIVALELGCDFIGCEIDEKHADAARERLCKK